MGMCSQGKVGTTHISNRCYHTSDIPLLRYFHSIIRIKFILNTGVKPVVGQVGENFIIDDKPHLCQPK